MATDIASRFNKLCSATKLVVAFDTANETISVAIGRLDELNKSVHLLASLEEQAHRASNTRLLPIVDGLFVDNGLDRADIACVCVGVGPGSFTGVRIAMATAKGISTALNVPLVGVSTLGAVADNVWACGVRGELLVCADAMRKEIYPAYFRLTDEGVTRQTSDTVIKAVAFEFKPQDEKLFLAGDALAKYCDLLESNASVANVELEVLPQGFWQPTGAGLLLELERIWQSGSDILSARDFDPMRTLPVYTRLSDAEENERARLADGGFVNLSPRNLTSGVQGSINGAQDSSTFTISPFDSALARQAADLEADVMGSDAWSESMILNDVAQPGRSWWMATINGRLVGYAGALFVADEMELLKIAVAPEFRRVGIARELMHKLAEDARNLAAVKLTLEVRASNSNATAFYRTLGLQDAGVRPKYYSDGEDALIMSCDIASLFGPGLEGLRLSKEAVCAQAEHPLILAIETSCDETAASIVDGASGIMSNVVASQIDFHARFGGVVPEIASRKHVEAISAVVRLALEDASVQWCDLDSIAVTYAPGLVGALVVGVAFAKGAAWALDIPIIAVNHLEGHLYANKTDVTFAPPAVVSLVSGGNTMLVHMRDWQDYRILGETIDDAVGEAFDKVAKSLGLPYPGGPEISRLAADGDPDAIDFPRALMHSGDYRFSLSGLKTAVSVYIEKVRESGEELNMSDVCASFQAAVIDVQVEKARRAIRETGVRRFCVGGGVSANPAMREAYERMCEQEGVKLTLPPLEYCGDNAAMIGLVAQDRYLEGSFMSLDGDAFAHASLDKPY